MISEDEERVIIEAMMSQQSDMRDCHASQTPPKRTPRWIKFRAWIGL